MTKPEIEHILKNDYSRERWKDLLNNLFHLHQVDYSLYDADIPTTSDIVQTFVRYGTIRLENTEIGIYEVTLLPNEVIINANRVGLRKIVKNEVTPGLTDAALIVFVEPNSTNWRLTFLAKEWDASLGQIIESTHKKRYTYIFGKDESCKTAKDSFHSLIEKNGDLGINDLLNAFSIEKVSKEFFKEYKHNYQNFVQFITGKRYIKEKGKWTEKIIHPPHAFLTSMFSGNEKEARDFCKKMLGRIIFLYFVQKKNWLGASNLDYSDGKPNFIRLLFEQSNADETFYPVWLSKLFFDTLNDSDRQEENFEMPDGTLVKVPFLNGGLFEKDKVDERAGLITFPPPLFSNDNREIPLERGFLDFLDAFNFTVYEDSPDEHTVAVDPEMLGEIFENLLEDNKDKGTFYTPKEVVHFMCQESLIEYLLNKLNPDPNDVMNTRSAISALIKNQEGAGINNYEDKILIHLKGVKVCDPAIGSGAFPMGVLQEIYQAVECIHSFSPDKTEEVWELSSGWDAGEVKSHIIENSIYGVDIEKGAVDIARLRFWLSLIVDEKKPHPLPNLDYKIMQGNSLLEQFENIPLSNLQNNKKVVYILEGENQMNIFGNAVGQQVRFDVLETKLDSLNKYLNEYFKTENLTRKTELKAQINLIIHEHLHFNIDLRKGKQEILLAETKVKLASIRFYDNDAVAKRKQKEKQKELLEKEVEVLEAEIQRLEEVLIQLDTIQETNDRPYFLWQLMFKDVFDDGGFDIVIGNPPYVQLQKMGKKADDLERVGFETFTRTGDIYCLFYEAGFKLLKPKGLLTFITSNKWMRAAYGEALRKYFTTQTNPLTLIDFGGFQVFESATVDTNIFVGQKSAFKNKVNTCVLGKEFSLNNRWLNLYIRIS